MMTSEIPDLDASLAATKESLLEFSRAVESEFLELGRNLRDIAGHAQEVGRLSDAVIATASGQTEDAAIQFAFQLLKKAEDLVRATREQHNQVLMVFKQLQIEFKRMARERNILDWILSPFKLTKIQFRLQACDFDADTRKQYSMMAETIGTIIKDIESAVDERFLTLERNAESAEKLAVRLNSLSLQQNHRTKLMLSQTRSQLATLNEVLDSSRAIAVSMREHGASIWKGVSKAIMALQCHDIVRQKIEHICAASDQMRLHLGNATAKDSESMPDSVDTYLADVGRLQLAHLQSTFTQLGNAGQQIGSALDEVQQNANVLAESALRAGMATLDGDVIEVSIESIHKVLALMTESVAHVREVLVLVQRLRNEFSTCTSEVMPLTQRLRLMAMNAQIAATKVQAGKVLETVAQNTRRVADEAGEELVAISTQLGAVIDAVTNLSERLADFCEVAEEERRVLEKDAFTAEGKLGELEGGLRGAVAKIAAANQTVSARARKALSGMHFPAAVGPTLGEIQPVFKELAGVCSGASALLIPSAVHTAALKRNYTMADEHAVHSLAEGGSGQATAPVADATKGNDNLDVELF